MMPDKMQQNSVLFPYRIWRENPANYGDAGCAVRAKRRQNPISGNKCGAAMASAMHAAGIARLLPAQPLGLAGL
jgi:hypothetical protein